MFDFYELLRTAFFFEPVFGAGDEDDDHDHDHGLDLDALTWGPIGPQIYDLADALPNVGDVFADPGAQLPITVAEGAFEFGVTVVDTVGGIGQDVLDVFAEITQLALATWSQFLGAAEGASIEVQVNVGGTDAVASAGPAGLFIDGILDVNENDAFDTGDIVLAIAGSLLEMQTGVDPNDVFDEVTGELISVPDIIVNVNEELLASGDFFFDTTLQQDVPVDQIDFYSVILHELGHGLGFFGLANEPGVLPAANFGTPEDPIIAEIATLYDLQTEVVDGRPFFTGASVQNVYGEAAPLEYLTGSGGSDISHWQALVNPDGAATDLRLALMNPFIIRGDRVAIGDLELALMADIGHTIVQSTGQFINEFDPLPDEILPTAFVAQDFSLQDGEIVFTVALDDIPPFLSIASGVAVFIEGPTGAFATDRALFQPGETSGTVAVDAASFLTEDLTDRRGTEIDTAFRLTLYNPAQAELEESPVYIVEVQGLFGTSRADYLRGTNGDDALFSGAGNDRLVGGNGDDQLDAGSGNDRAYGGNGNDEIDAGAGDDRVVGGNGNDTVFGGEGDDVISANNGTDLVFGDGGDDVIRLGNGDDAADAGAGDDDVRGGNGDDLIFAGAGDDTLSGNNGGDTLVAEGGTDLLIGGNGADVFDVSGAENAIVRDLDFSEGDVLVVPGGGITNQAILEAFIASAGVTAQADGDDLVIAFGEGQTVTLEDFAMVDVA